MALSVLVFCIMFQLFSPRPMAIKVSWIALRIHIYIPAMYIVYQIGNIIHLVNHYNLSFRSYVFY